MSKDADTDSKAKIVDRSRLIIQRGSKSFAAAAKLFDGETRDNAYMLYAWCRYCDDQIDNQELGFNSQPQSADVTQNILDNPLDFTIAQFFFGLAFKLGVGDFNADNGC